MAFSLARLGPRRGKIPADMRTDGDNTPPPSAVFVPPDLNALIETETRLRIDYRNIPRAPQEIAREFLRSMTGFVELLHLAAVFVEVSRRKGCQTLADAMRGHGDIDRQVHALTSLRTSDVLDANPWLQTGPPPKSDALPQLDKLVQAVGSFVGAFPIKELVELGTHVGLQELSARCQVAHDALSRFIKRNDPLMDQRLNIAGPAYASGQISLEDVAHVIELSIPDTVALLEEYGYARPVEHFSLTSESRATLFGRLREDRLKRSGKPNATSSAVVRDAIASQRIEDIDARPWIEAKLG